MDDTKIELPTPISTDGPPVDVPLLRKAVEWAEAEAAKPLEQSEWFQGAYATSGRSIQRTCGTAFCIAGYVANLNGLWPKRINDDEIMLTNGQTADEYAAERLGLTGGEGCNLYTKERSLFLATNSIADIRTIADRIAARAGERL